MALGTALIGGALALGGAALSSGSQSRAARSAADATQYAADRSAEVVQRNYDLSAQALAPWQRSGLQANALLNDFYGIQQQPLPAMGGVNPVAPGETMGGLPFWRGREDIADNGGGLWRLGGYNASNVPVGTQPATGGTMGTATTAPVNSRDAFRKFIENSDYGFQFGEGANRINSGYAGAGTLKSGAAMKALEGFRQNLQQGYRGEYLAGLANQQGVGFGAASAQAGVSQNLGNSLANIYQNQGANAANAALARGNNSFGNALSMIGGGLLGYRG